MECDDFAGTSRLLLDTENIMKCREVVEIISYWKNAIQVGTYKTTNMYKELRGKRDTWNGKYLY